MTPINTPQVILGHNQFFGVDHLSARRGSERAAYFGDIRNIITVIRAAQDIGGGGLMLSTHPRAIEICDALRRDVKLRNHIRMFPLLPYAQKYVTKANEVGMVRAVTGTLYESSMRDRIRLGTDVVRFAVRRDPVDMVRALMSLELRMFRRLDMPVVFLHDAISDLLLGLSVPRVFEVYASTLRKRFGARVGVATKNLPLLIERFSQWGLELPVVLTHVNKIGFHINPSQHAHEACLLRHDLDVMAMGTLASGFLKPKEAADYVRQFPSVKMVVVGASTPEHIRDSFAHYLSHASSPSSAAES